MITINIRSAQKSSFLVLIAILFLYPSAQAEMGLRYKNKDGSQHTLLLKDKVNKKKMAQYFLDEKITAVKGKPTKKVYPVSPQDYSYLNYLHTKMIWDHKYKRNVSSVKNCKSHIILFKDKESVSICRSQFETTHKNYSKHIQKIKKRK